MLRLGELMNIVPSTNHMSWFLLSLCVSNQTNPRKQCMSRIRQHVHQDSRWDMVVGTYRFVTFTSFKGSHLIDPRATRSYMCRQVGFHVCPLPAQCKTFLPHAQQVWEVHIPHGAAIHAVDCWQMAVSELYAVRVLSDQEVRELSTGILDGPNAQVSMWEGKLHSFEGMPSHVNRQGTRYWHWKGLEHRENDLPQSSLCARILGIG